MKRLLAVLAPLLALSAPQVKAAYPERTITVVVPFAAGGATDVIARLYADHMGRTLGQQIVVENVTGAGGTIGALRVARATPDGYTLLMGNLGTHAASAGLYTNLASDPRADFEPIMNAAATPMVVAAKKDLPVKDFREFVAYVKTHGPTLNYGTGGVGATSHLACLFLDTLLETRVRHVPFRGSGPALNALMGGQIDYVCDQTVGIVPQIQSKDVKGLVVAVQDRIPVIPDVPTSAEEGLPAFQATGWNALFAPKGTPKEIVDKLNVAARAALKDETIRSRLLALGAELPNEAGQTPAALGTLVRTEIDKWVPIIKKAGVTGN
jgi:tripartite-type tricarboxylate transporter receptor subunit TctC